ncbi:MAG: TlpA disulfide reductase family protein [Myxococcota bacterium]
MRNRGSGALLMLLAICACRSGAPEPRASETELSPRRIPILVEDDRFVPAEVRAAPGEVVDLVFSRESEADCTDRVVVNGATTALPRDRIAIVEVRAPPSGRVAFACPSGRITGAVQITTEAVDPGLEHPRIDDPMPEAYAASILGKVAPEWTVSHWDGSPPTPLAALRGRVVVVRFFMDECPFCRATLPALGALHRELRDEPVVFVGLFHSKPRGTEADWDTARKTARRWGADYILGYDPLWTTLEAWYGDLLKQAPTSVTFVIDRDGKFAYVHPGPVFHPSTHPEHARCNADYLAVRGAILRALGR